MSGFIDIIGNTIDKISSAKEKLSQVVTIATSIVEGTPSLLNNILVDSDGHLTGPSLTTAQGIFGDSLDYDSIIVNDTSFMADLNQHWNNGSRPFVFGNTINSDGPLTQEELIHELTHVWQYQTGGLGYITDSIGDNTYHYNADSLGTFGSLPLGDRMQNFNVEQQAEIVSHYFELATEPRPLSGELRLHNMQDAGGNQIIIDESNIDQYLGDLSPYIEEVRTTPPQTGVVQELNEAPVEIIEEVGEGVEEVLGEAKEGINEIQAEIAEGDGLGVVTETIEAGGEVLYETVEGGAETIYEVGEGAVEIGVDGATDGFNWLVDQVTGD